ncbi:MAG: hypothetical protein ACI87W_002721, partial [Halieaceae bacterium]
MGITNVRILLATVFAVFSALATLATVSVQGEVLAAQAAPKDAALAAKLASVRPIAADS